MTGYDPQEIKASQPLKPCPFCGGDVGMLYIAPHTHTTLAGHMPDHPGSVHIECVTCEYVMHGSDEPTLTARWNSRADAADEALSALKEGRRALGVAVKHAGGDPETHVVCRQMVEAIAKLEEIKDGFMKWLSGGGSRL